MTSYTAYAKISDMSEDISRQTQIPEFNLDPRFNEQYLTERNQWLDARLNDDPARPLPEVSLVKIDKPPLVVSFDDEPQSPRLPEEGNTRVTITGLFDINSADGTKVGFVVLNKSNLETRTTAENYIGDIRVLDDKRGQGYGPATYLAILKSLPAGEGLRTEGRLSADAKRVWSALVDRGVAKCIGDPEEPGVVYETVF